MTAVNRTLVTTERDGSLSGAPTAPVRAQVTRAEGPASESFEPWDEDHKQWRDRLRVVFGTLSPEFVDASMRQLVSLAMLPRHRVATSTSLSAALALITSLAPRDEAQASLAIHIACLHAASLEVLARMMETVSERRLIPMASAAAKLERAFQGAIDNYYRMQRGATQVFRIERVEVQPGAQAIVGVVPRK